MILYILTHVPVNENFVGYTEGGFNLDMHKIPNKIDVIMKILNLR